MCFLRSCLHFLHALLFLTQDYTYVKFLSMIIHRNLSIIRRNLSTCPSLLVKYLNNDSKTCNMNHEPFRHLCFKMYDHGYSSALYQLGKTDHVSSVFNVMHRLYIVIVIHIIRTIKIKIDSPNTLHHTLTVDNHELRTPQLYTQQLRPSKPQSGCIPDIHS